MGEPKPCPFCGSKNAAPYSVKSCHSVLCVACGGEGPEADSEEGAIVAWNLRPSGVPEPVGINGLTEAETSATASVFGLTHRGVKENDRA